MIDNDHDNVNNGHTDGSMYDWWCRLITTTIHKMVPTVIANIVRFVYDNPYNVDDDDDDDGDVWRWWRHW